MTALLEYNIVDILHLVKTYHRKHTLSCLHIPGFNVFGEEKFPVGTVLCYIHAYT